MTDGLDLRVCWRYGPFTAYEVRCPYCETTWCSVFLLGTLGTYFVHCLRNRDTHNPDEPTGGADR